MREIAYPEELKREHWEKQYGGTAATTIPKLLEKLSQLENKYKEIIKFDDAHTQRSPYDNFNFIFTYYSSRTEYTADSLIKCIRSVIPTLIIAMHADGQDGARKLFHQQAVNAAKTFLNEIERQTEEGSKQARKVSGILKANFIPLIGRYATACETFHNSLQFINKCKSPNIPSLKYTLDFGNDYITCVDKIYTHYIDKTETPFNKYLSEGLLK